MASRDCPCGSGAPYRACCAPFHRSEREAPDATALMRSRYAAFATKEIEYLWRTLDPEHDDRARPKDEVLRELRAACATHKYMGLRIVDAAPADVAGIARVLFAARVFERGKDRSFVELSEFRHDGAGWRYLRGDGALLASIADVDALTIDTFPR
jgi:SEC-C motif-containing protein